MGEGVAAVGDAVVEVVGALAIEQAAKLGGELPVEVGEILGEEAHVSRRVVQPGRVTLVPAAARPKAVSCATPGLPLSKAP